jgi:hypothetical protein
MAARNEASFAFDGLLNPLIFLTNWSEAARTSSSVTGGSKLKRTLMFLHISLSVGGDRSNHLSYVPTVFLLYRSMPMLCGQCSCVVHAVDELV